MQGFCEWCNQVTPVLEDGRCCLGHPASVVTIQAQPAPVLPPDVPPLAKVPEETSPSTDVVPAAPVWSPPAAGQEPPAAPAWSVPAVTTAQPAPVAPPTTAPFTRQQGIDATAGRSHTDWLADGNSTGQVFAGTYETGYSRPPAAPSFDAPARSTPPAADFLLSSQTPGLQAARFVLDSPPPQVGTDLAGPNNGSFAATPRAIHGNEPAQPLFPESQPPQSGAYPATGAWAGWSPVTGAALQTPPDAAPPFATWEVAATSGRQYDTALAGQAAYSFPYSPSEGFAAEGAAAAWGSSDPYQAAPPETAQQTPTAGYAADLAASTTAVPATTGARTGGGKRGLVLLAVLIVLVIALGVYYALFLL